MARGGARAHSGPPPDPEALRRERADDQAGWTTLPAAGRQGSTPEWPLSVASERELEVWARQWSRPQATKWEPNGQHEEVAMYVRAFVVAEGPKAKSTDRNLVKQLQEYLGLSLPGLLRNRWRIAEMPVQDDSSRSAPKRAGLTVVKGGDAA